MAAWPGTHSTVLLEPAEGLKRRLSLRLHYGHGRYCSTTDGMCFLHVCPGHTWRRDRVPCPSNREGAPELDAEPSALLEAASFYIHGGVPLDVAEQCDADDIQLPRRGAVPEVVKHS